MVALKDIGFNDFLKTNHKKIIFFGAGRQFEKIASFYQLENQAFGIVDNDIKKIGERIKINNREIEIYSIELLNRIDANSYVIVISSSYYIYEMLEQIDNIKNIDGIDCYIFSLMTERNENGSFMMPNKTGASIPEIIHYCWFGGKPIPDHLKKYMESWREKCPGYKIVRWDENNYDISKNEYMRQAYEAKKWGFVPDYARLDIIEENGGIYLDTDVEILKSLDPLLSSKSFFGFADAFNVSLGLCFGGVAHNELIVQLKQCYEDKKFTNSDGSYNMTLCSQYQNPVFQKYGFELNNKFQDINGNLLYPSEVFSPEGVIGYHKNYTENTYTCHRPQISYESDEAREQFYISREKIKERIEKNYVTRDE